MSSSSSSSLPTPPSPHPHCISSAYSPLTSLLVFIHSGTTCSSVAVHNITFVGLSYQCKDYCYSLTAEWNKLFHSNFSVYVTSMVASKLVSWLCHLFQEIPKQVKDYNLPLAKIFLPQIVQGERNIYCMFFITHSQPLRQSTKMAFIFSQSDMGCTE